MSDLKTILIVDDSEIDRVVLKNILCNDFNVVEADSGYAALEILLKSKTHLDAMLLDISMPVLDGFGVLRILKENNAGDIPVFLITAEATKDNVAKAASFDISEFVRKPFDRDDILKRLRLKLGVVSDYKLSDADITETHKYVASLQSIYTTYLNNFGEEKGHYKRVADVMRIMLEKYASTYGRLDKVHIEIISRASYFYDIGRMAVPNKIFTATKLEDAERDIYHSHTVLGGELIHLNTSEHCRYFVQVCADMCTHHHERYDGKGFPHKIVGSNNLIYTQMCRLAARFDTLFYKYREHNGAQFDFAMADIVQDKGAVGEEVLSLLSQCKSDIIAHYKSMSVE